MTSKTFLYTFDANGNVGQLVDASNGSIVAHYEYDPFGNLVVSTGSESDSNVFRFSTKYYNAETELYYYGFRYYDPVQGRWRTRDPINELGFNLFVKHVISDVNILLDSHFFFRNDYSKHVDPLYVFVANNPIRGLDILGLQPSACERCGPNVTTSLKEVIRRERTKFFNDLNIDAKRQWLKCRTIIMWPLATTAWDIGEFAPHGGWPLLRNKFCVEYGCPTEGVCAETVQVDNGCFFVPAVNYVLFGMIGNVCQTSYKYTLDLVNKWKSEGRGHQADSETIAWTKAGFYGWPDQAPTPPMQQKLTKCKQDCPHLKEPMNIIWKESWFARFDFLMKERPWVYSSH